MVRWKEKEEISMKRTKNNKLKTRTERNNNNNNNNNNNSPQQPPEEQPSASVY